jgi:type II secretory pathway pseudopilin PulG
MVRRIFIAALVVSLGTSAASADDKSQRAWDDLRWLMTTLEAFSTDNDGLYAPLDAPREGALADLDRVLAPYYAGTYPKKPTPYADPWGHPYRFVISDSRRLYALYSLGPAGKLEPPADAFLKRLRNDRIDEAELTKERISQNVVVASGMLVFALREVLQNLQKARAESAPHLIHRQGDTPEHVSERDVEMLATAIEAYLATHDALPKELRGHRVEAASLRPVLVTPVPGHDLAFTDPWKRPYAIAISPSGLRAAVYTRGENNSLAPENEAMVQQLLRGELTSTAMTYGEAMMITSLVPKAAQ